MEVVDIVRSKIDKTVKYIFRLEDGLITEVSYINKDDGKDILCVSSHTGCNLGCRFCHTTDAIGRVKVRELTDNEIFDLVITTYQNLNLYANNRILLVSYMGCGEPLLNDHNVWGSMLQINWQISNSRFAVATLLPDIFWYRFFTLVSKVDGLKMPIKIHLSLHFTRDEIRKQWMPAALPIAPSIAALEFYRKLTKQSVEIHYALIDGVNDSVEDSQRLAHLLRDRDIPVKILKYNKRACLDYHASEKVDFFQQTLSAKGIDNEYYEPPGIDVGASCGQFLLDYYLKYNGK